MKSIKDLKIACVIPARLKSTRFPEKVLKNLNGKPILSWVWDAANNCEVFEEIIFAVDDERTAKLIDSFGGKWVMTSPECPSGTMRLVEFRNKTEKKFDLWLNWQADEPLIPQDMIFDLLKGVDLKNDVYTLKKRISNLEALKTNYVKVVDDKDGKALYFSRAPIPFIREHNEEYNPYYKHVGLYLYHDEAIKKISLLQPSELENIEKLEQLTFLYNGLKIRVLETIHEGKGIDFEQDLKDAENYLINRR